MYHTDGSDIKLVFRALRSMLVADVLLQPASVSSLGFSLLYFRMFLLLPVFFLEGYLSLSESSSRTSLPEIR